MKFENLEVSGFEAAKRAMRNPFFSQDKANPTANRNLLESLIEKGAEHRKVLRGITFSVDFKEIPRFVLMELSTYKIGFTMSVSSTMHTIMRDGVKLSDFEYDPDDSEMAEIIQKSCDLINQYAKEYRKSIDPEKKKRLKYKAKCILPEGYKRVTVTLFGNYEGLRTMYFQRRNHELPEWHEICAWIETLPESWMITMPEKQKEPIGYKVLNEDGLDVSECRFLSYDLELLIDDDWGLAIACGDKFEWIYEK